MKASSPKWLPWYRIAWNLIWLMPLIILRCLFVATIFCARGPFTAYNVWRDTE